jgi:CheY-like chemotaxis protein
MSSAKPVILVVDDDEPIIILMRSLLREFGFEPVTATTGAEAIESVHARHPDLILLDKNMPGMSGDDVIRALRAEDGLDHVPILILSGEPVSPRELEALGANGAILKPFDVTDLVEKIRAHVGVRA